MVVGISAAAGIFSAVADGIPDSAHVLFEYGGLGIVLAWLMFRVEKRLDQQAKSDDKKAAAIEHMGESLLIAVTAMRTLDRSISEMAADKIKARAAEKEEERR